MTKSSTSLFATLTKVQDWSQRRNLFRTAMVDGPPARVVGALESALGKPHANPNHSVAALSLILAVVHGDVPGPRWVVLHNEAAAQGKPLLAHVMLKLALARTEKPVYRESSGYPLGFRKSLARTAERDVLMRVRNDPHPSVVSIYLQNPHITLRDVVAVASRRPNYAPTLHAILASPRWLTEHSVRNAVYHNRYTPDHTKLAAALTLRTQELRKTHDVISKQVRELRDAR